MKKEKETISTPSQIERIKQKIIKRFYTNVRGKKPNVSSSNARHDGKVGHWLEKQMGVNHNASNTPDIEGFEMKNQTGSKTTFGDWSADYYIFQDPVYKINRDEFLKIFGAPNAKKKGRYSWSGKPCPKIDAYNIFGQKLCVDKKGNIFVYYDYTKDARPNKSKIVPKLMQTRNLVVAQWEALFLKKKLEKKFNMHGWFKCLLNKDMIYTEIVFGAPMSFKNWIKGVRKGIVFFDSGMYQGNLRPYSQWRANNKYWDDLVIEKY